MLDDIQSQIKELEAKIEQLRRSRDEEVPERSRPEQRGHKAGMSPEARKKMSDRVKQAHKEGKLKHLYFKPGNKPDFSSNPEAYSKGITIAQAIIRGSHGFGKMERGKPDHQFAKAWKVESPEGEVYEFDNLLEWARQHEDRLAEYDEDDGSAETPVWHRFAHGIACPKGQWYGWIRIGRKERVLQWKAKLWKVKSPQGIIYEFTSMDGWARQNEHLMDDTPGPHKTPLWYRFSMKMRQRRGQWNGWTRLADGQCSWTP